MIVEREDHHMSKALILTTFVVAGTAWLSACDVENPQSSAATSATPYAVIQITGARWGTVGDPDSIVDLVATRCAQKETCKVEATREWIGYDKHPGPGEGLWIGYLCIRNNSEVGRSNFFIDEPYSREFGCSNLEFLMTARPLIRATNFRWGIVTDADDITDLVRVRCGNKEHCNIESTVSWVGYDKHPGSGEKLWADFLCFRGTTQISAEHFELDEGASRDFGCTNN